MPHSQRTRTRHGIKATILPEIDSVVHFHVGEQTVGHGHPDFHDLKARFHAPNPPEEAHLATKPPHHGPSGF